jgi:hypothetical protein
VRIVLYVFVALLLPWAYIQLFTPPRGLATIPPIGDSARAKVYVIGWNYHSSILVAQQPEWRLGPEGNEAAPYVEYGWGDRGFMMESNYWPHALVAALLLPTESVMYVRGLDELPKEGAPATFVYEREVDGRQLRLLLAALEEDFVRTAGGGRARAYAPVEGYGGRFYPGREYYIFWSNCNSWVLSRLRDAEIDVSPTGVLVEQQVPGRLKGFIRLREG